MKKTRILFFNNFYSSGGVEIFLQNLVGYLDKKGYDVTVSAAPRTKADFHHPYGPHVKCVWRPLLESKGYRKYSPAWFFDHLRYRLLETIVETYLFLQNYDIVVASQEKWVMRITAKLRGKRKFAWVHSEYSTRRQLHNNCFASAEEELACMRQFEKVVCVSEVSKIGLIQTLGDPGNLVVKYSPIDVDRIVRLSTIPCPMVRERSRPLLVSIGRLDPEKQYPLLLEACAALSREIPFELWIVGDGSDRAEMESYISRNKMDYVHLLGAQANPYHYLAQADFFIHSSKTESYCFVVQEALILGVPVVAVSSPGLEESLDPSFGVLTDNSAEALSDAISAFLHNPDLLSQYRERIAAQYCRDSLFEPRLERITSLWEDNGQHSATGC